MRVALVLRYILSSPELEDSTTTMLMRFQQLAKVGDPDRGRACWLATVSLYDMHCLRSHV